MKGHAYLDQSSSAEEATAVKQTFATTDEIELYFNRLSEITDRVAMINSEYQADIESAVRDLENFMPEEDFRIFSEMNHETVQAFLSHMSFHREIIADIINEARQLLIEERREFVRRLVAYHKTFVKKFSSLEKQLKS